MNDQNEIIEFADSLIATEPEDLKPKKPSNRAPEGIRTFTACRQNDETGISGEGVVIEGATFATGHTVIHWLTPAPRGSIAFFDAFDDFIKIHVKSHPTNNTIIKILWTRSERLATTRPL